MMCVNNQLKTRFKKKDQTHDQPSGAKSWWDLAVPRVGSCWLWMWVAGGLRSRVHSSLSWRRQRLDENRVSCREGPSRQDEVGSHPLLRLCEGNRNGARMVRTETLFSRWMRPGWLRESFSQAMHQAFCLWFVPSINLG